MKIFLGADHRGFELKETIKTWLIQVGYDVEDCGNDHLDPLDDSPDYAQLVVDNILTNKDARGILFCGSGIDMTIAANRYKGIYCALGINAEHVRHGRENDHINCLSIPAEFVSHEEVKEMIDTFLNTPPKQDEKYLRRIQKLDS